MEEKKSSKHWEPLERRDQVLPAPQLVFNYMPLKKSTRLRSVAYISWEKQSKYITNVNFTCFYIQLLFLDQRFAMMEEKAILANILRNDTVESF